MKRLVLDFVEGNIPPKEFWDMCQEDERIFDWIQSVVPKDKICYKNTPYVEYTEDGICLNKIKSEIIPYDIRIVIKQSCNYSSTMLGKLLNFHGIISRLMKEVFPNENFIVSQELSNKFMFMLDACPRYIGGYEVDCSGILEELLDTVPEGLSMKQKINWYRSQVKEMFHITSNYYPRWIQEADWPMNNNRPMRFVSQNKAPGEGNYYIFEDVETGERRTVFQCT